MTNNEVERVFILIAVLAITLIIGFVVGAIAGLNHLPACPSPCAHVEESIQELEECIEDLEKSPCYKGMERLRP